jgi:hypothetical protein
MQPAFRANRAGDETQNGLNDEGNLLIHRTRLDGQQIRETAGCDDGGKMMG